MTLFCPTCNTYIPTGAACPTCDHERPPLHTPVAPEQAIWQDEAPGRVAHQLALAEIDGEPVALAAWGHVPRFGDTRPLDGGVVAVRLSDGEQVWAHALGLPVEGGVTVAGRSVLVGCGERGVGGGEGWLAALDTATGEERWRSRLGGNVRSTPVVADTWIFVTSDDGQLSCLDLRTGRLLWRKRACARSAPMPASPLLLKTRQVADSVIVGAYGSRHGREPGQLTSFDLRGRQRWQRASDGYVRGTPVLADPTSDGDRLYVSAYGLNPSRGLLSAYRARTGRPLWTQPFVVQPQPDKRRTYNFSASPLVQGKTVYVGSLDHHLYAVSAASGELLWRIEVGGGIATQPAWVEGLIVFGANDGRVYAVDPDEQKIVWKYNLGAAALTNPLIVDGHIIVAAENGRLAILPWHLGRYAWAAARLSAAKRHDQAGDLWALAAHYAVDDETILPWEKKAIIAWGKAGSYEKIAHYWLARGRQLEAAQALQQAGKRWRTRNRQRAARSFDAAALLHFALRSLSDLSRSTRALADCARLPCIQVRAVNAPTYILWEEGELTLRLRNEGVAPAPAGVTFWLGGALQSAIQIEIQEPMPPGQIWNIPVRLIPTQEQTTLVVEIEYASGHSDHPVLRDMHEITIHAVEPRQKPLQIGDVHTLQVTIANATQEGVAIETRDVALMRSQGDIGTVNVAGDTGAVITRGK